MRLSGLVSHRRRRTFMGNGSGVSRGDRNRNARLGRLRELVPITNAIVGIDLADRKQMVVVTDHDSQVVARKTSADHTVSASASKSRLPRTSILRPTRSSMAAPGLRERDEPASLQRESGTRMREQSKSSASPAPGGTAPQINPRRRTRQPSGEIKWS